MLNHPSNHSWNNRVAQYYASQRAADVAESRNRCGRSRVELHERDITGEATTSRVSSLFHRARLTNPSGLGDLPDRLRLGGPLAGILGSSILACLGVVGIVASACTLLGIEATSLPVGALLLAGLAFTASGSLMVYAHFVALHEAILRAERNEVEAP